MLIKLELMLSDRDGSGRLVLRKGRTMGGFFRFLLGGALGAVLGIMFVKKQAVTKTSRTAGAPASAPGAGLPRLAPRLAGLRPERPLWR